MASRSEILSATKSKGNKKSTLAQRGRWNSTNSGAFLRAPSVPVGPGAAGSTEKAKANFFNAILKDVIPAAKKVKDQKDKEQVNFGKASWTRATKEQREKWAFAIKNGHAFEGDSPYFRQGVAIAHTEAMAGRYAQEMFQKYEDWTDKNDEKSGSFDDWINGQDETWQSSFEHIDDEVLTNHFLPMQAQIRDRLRTQHTQRLNENYRAEAKVKKQNQLFGRLNKYFSGVYEDGKNAHSSFFDIVFDQESNHTDNMRKFGLYTKLIESGNATKQDMLDIDQKNGGEMWKEYSRLANKKEKLENKVVLDIGPARPKETGDSFAKRHGYTDWAKLRTEYPKIPVDELYEGLPKEGFELKDKWKK